MTLAIFMSVKQHFPMYIVLVMDIICIGIDFFSSDNNSMCLETWMIVYCHVVYRCLIIQSFSFSSII